jgi:hypoxia up-regulated 1
MWNWATRLFLAEARMNLTAEETAGVLSKWTAEELDGLEKTLKDHEIWLNEWVEKQKSVKLNQDPVISTTEMKARAKTLEMQLQKLVKRKIPKPRKATTSSTPASTSTAASENVSSSSVVEPEQENQTSEMPLPSSPPESSHHVDEL